MSRERSSFILVRVLIATGILVVLATVGMFWLLSSKPYAVVTYSPFNLRAEADSSAALVGETVAGQAYEVERLKLGSNTIYGRFWYEIKLEDGSAAYLVKASDNEQAHLSEQEYEAAFTAALSPAFEADLAKFPESYREQLRFLHYLYPNWTFEAVEVKDPWPVVLAAQSEREDKNLVQYEDTAYFQPYAWMVKNSTVYDGSNWYPATEEAIAWHMDPRNFLNPRDVFQFLNLRNTSASTDESGVRWIFGSNRTLLEMVPDVMQAANEAGLLPEALASRMRQEITSGETVSLLARGLLDPENPPLVPGSASPGFLSEAEQLEQLESLVEEGQTLTEEQEAILASLRSGGPGYAEPTTRYYNLYNIGATPDPGAIQGAAMNGVRFAAAETATGTANYLLPWTSVNLAARGGAQFIQEEYVAGGQDTVYFQKFDVITGTHYHQYMQAVFSALHEGRRFQSVWSENERLSEPLTFRIPVYSELPEKPAQGEPLS